MADLPVKSPVTVPEPTAAAHVATKNYVDATKAQSAVNTRTATYTLGLGDANNVVEMNSTSATTVTVPPNSSAAFPIGTTLWITRLGGGAVTLAAGAGVTLRNPGLSFDAQYVTLRLRKRGTDEWVVTGRAAASAPPPPPPPAGTLMVVTQAQLNALPTTGTAWTNLLNIANGTSFPVNIDDQDNITAGKLTAVGLVYAKTQTESYRTKVVTALDQLKTAVPTAESRALSWGRQLAGYAISAALVGYNDAALKEWFASARTATLPGHSRWVNVQYTCQNDGGNWGAWCTASMAAINSYIGDTQSFDTTYQVFRGLMGDTTAWFQFQAVAEYDPTWVCGQPTAANWHGPSINPPCDPDRDGADVLDIARGASPFPTVEDRGRMYTWEALSGWVIAARIFDYGGKTGVYGLSQSALKRAAQFLQRNGGWPAQFSASYVAAAALKKIYATDFGPLPSYGPARSFTGTDWLPGTSTS